MGVGVRKLKVLSVWPLSTEQQQKIQTISSAIALDVQPYDEQTIEAYLAKAEIEVLYTLHARFSPERTPTLKWVQLYTAGIDQLAGFPIINGDVTVTTTSGIHGRPMAEYVIAILVSLTRRFPQMWALQRNRQWPANALERFRGGEVRGKTLGLIGYGNIGREIGRVAHCFGLRVIAMNRDGIYTGNRDDPAERIYASQDSRDMLPLCDYVVVCLPLTPETEGMIGEAEFKRMRRSAYFINVSRGQVVRQAELIRALREEWIAGAALDAVFPEPLPASSELYDLPNVIITPHISAATFLYSDRAVDAFSENLHRYLAGEPLRNVADKKRGY